MLHMARGNDNAEIAAIMDLDVRLVRCELSVMYETLIVRDRYSAIVAAYQRNILFFGEDGTVHAHV